jgi:hypothetical protein
MVTDIHKSGTAGAALLQVLNDVPPPKGPPEAPAGWMVGPPDFVGVGAMKSGTTWWWAMLAGHPEISPRPNPSAAGAPHSAKEANRRLYRAKEIHFFDHYGRMAQIDPVEYHRYFPRPAGCITGEWTPRYMYDFWTPPMLHAAAPGARLLVMLRDPLQRFVSGLAHHQKFGSTLTGPVMEHQFHRGFYWQQLRNLLNYFERDRILVLQYERCVREPAREAARTFEFLGLDPERWTAPADFTAHVGLTYAKPLVDQATLRAVWQATEPDVRRLLADFPEIDPTLWPSLDHHSLDHHSLDRPRGSA